jgi:hypothetical protein
MKKLCAAAAALLSAIFLLSCPALASTTLLTDTSNPARVKVSVEGSSTSEEETALNIDQGTIQRVGGIEDLIHPPYDEEWVSAVSETPDRDRDEQEFYPDEPTASISPVPIFDRSGRDRNPCTGR